MFARRSCQRVDTSKVNPITLYTHRNAAASIQYISFPPGCQLCLILAEENSIQYKPVWRVAVFFFIHSAQQFGKNSTFPLFSVPLTVEENTSILYIYTMSLSTNPESRLTHFTRIFSLQMYVFFRFV